LRVIEPQSHHLLSSAFLNSRLICGWGLAAAAAAAAAAVPKMLVVSGWNKTERTALVG